MDPSPSVPAESPANLTLRQPSGQLARLQHAAAEEPQAVLGVLAYWLHRETLEGPRRVDFT